MRAEETTRRIRTRPADPTALPARSTPRLHPTPIHGGRDDVKNAVRVASEGFTVFGAVKDDLGGMDLLFIFLGVSTAFGLVMKATNMDAQRRVRQSS